MSLFGFGDISFNKTADNRGPLKALEGSTQFSATALRYPADVGNYDKGHYMVFYIRQQKNTKFRRGVAGNDEVINENSLSGSKTFKDLPLVGNAGTNIGSDLLKKLNSGLGSLNGATNGALSGLTKSVSSAASGIVGGINNLFGQKASAITGDTATTQRILSNNLSKITNQRFIKTTELTTDAIALYMPDTLQFTYQQSYDQLNLGTEIGGKALAAGQASLEQFTEEGIKASLGSIVKSAGLAITQKAFEAGGAALKSSQTAQVAFTGLFGAVQNPILEMIYKAPNFRTFQYDFVFYPRDEKEALEVQRIIERFRFHQAPEFYDDTQGFLIPPSEFDIRFYYGGVQNPNIPKVATCVLTSIDVNYAPNGFSAYEIPGESQPSLGRTGMPVSIQMTLQFQEVTYLTKKDFTSDGKMETAGKGA